jgi:sugar O-acyltransferase (sialic acid O-acetyltransferase NeuD family)
VAFTVDERFLHIRELHSLPVRRFENLELFHDPEDTLMLIPIGFWKCNSVRADRYYQAKKRGYKFATYISSRAIIAPGVKIGENCMVFDGCIIQPFTNIGNNSIIRSGAHVSHHNIVGDHCFIAPRAALSGGIIVENNCTIGVNATIKEDIIISNNCFIAAGAVVLRNTKPWGLYKGNPAMRDPRSTCELPI